jgi:hypothetical protein
MANRTFYLIYIGDISIGVKTIYKKTFPPSANVAWIIVNLMKIELIFLLYSWTFLPNIPS